MSKQETDNLLQLIGKNQEGNQWLVPILKAKFLIGRKEGCDLRLEIEGVSRIHAEIHQKADGWWISDCGSTNGTFLNHKRITQELKLSPGDLLQFSDMRFFVTEYSDVTEKTKIINPHSLIFERMMMEKAVTPYFQPIINLSNLHPIGFEILGRTNYQGLPESPSALFQIAKKLDLEIELSKLFRETALSQASYLGIKELLFFNMLPAEMDVNSISQDLETVREKYPLLNLAMELHESVITDVATIRKMHQILKRLDISLVYDDFGSGQARLLELMEAPPDIIKFDICLIHNINARPKSSQDIVATLVKMASDLGVRSLAEGVETREEAEICSHLGFHLAQGFYFDKLTPVNEHKSQ
jgi:EAL domain-containing protein (putative c-di-GMP-specific phosphodiesterase class I)